MDLLTQLQQLDVEVKQVDANALMHASQMIACSIGAMADSVSGELVYGGHDRWTYDWPEKAGG